MLKLPNLVLGLMPVEALPPALHGWEEWRFEHWGPWLATRLLHAALYIVGAFLLNHLWRSLLSRLHARTETSDLALQNEADRRVRTLLLILRRVGSGLVWASVLLIILHDFGLEIGPLLAGLGIAGAALGFGAQYLVQDWIAGFFNIVENNYAVGDVIETGTMRGTVERVTTRTTHLRAVGGEVHIIQNGTIRAVTNFTRQWGRAILDVGVDCRSDIGAVFEALGEVGQRATADPVSGTAFLEPAEVLGVTQLGDSLVTVRLWAKTDPQRKWEVERLLRRVVVEVFARRGIPFPTRTVEIAGLPVDLAARTTPRKDGGA